MNQNKRKRVLWTSLCPTMTTKFSIKPHRHKTSLKIWVFKGSPSVAFKNCWKVSQEREKLGSLLNPRFLILHLNLLLALLSHLHPPGSNKLILRGERNQRVRRWWNLEDLVLPVKRRLTSQPSSRKPVMSPAEDQKGAMFNCPNPKHSSQLPCLVVSP